MMPRFTLLQKTYETGWMDNVIADKLLKFKEKKAGDLEETESVETFRYTG